MQWRLMGKFMLYNLAQYQRSCIFGHLMRFRGQSVPKLIIYGTLKKVFGIKYLKNP
jgi:hypothetical protein